ncbi:MAG: PD-(D/E)XK nuclease family protein [Candidatus Binatia bacterium]
MQTILGRFHPDLEDALVREILSHKRGALLCPLLILVPSSSLRRRLKVLLASEHRLDLLNVYILTFHQLSLRLFEELKGPSSPTLQDDLFLEESLRQIIRMRYHGTSAFSGLEERVGGCAALWQTLRDLKDGRVEPTRVLEALNEGYFNQETGKKLFDLFFLFQSFLSCCDRRKIRDYSDLDISVIKQIPSSVFLKQFSQIFYYGFYDLTQVQVDLFQTVARYYPTTLLFPLVYATPKHPAWAFAQRFYESYIQGLGTEGSQIGNLAVDSGHAQAPVNTSVQSKFLPIFCDEPDACEFSLPQDFRCTIIDCSGMHDEVLTAAKEILSLVSDEGLSFHEIGVVARNIEAYLPWIKQIFPEHGISISTSAKEPLVQFPLVKTVILLINLPLKHYLRSLFVDLVSSPFFYTQRFCPEETMPRPDLWDLFTRQLGVTQGLEEWRRLERHLNGEVILTEDADTDEDHRTLTVPASQLRILWKLFTELYRDLDTLPKEATWSHYASAWQELLHKYLMLSDESVGTGDSQEKQAREMILYGLEGLAGLEAINPKVTLEHFIRTYQHWLERSSLSFMPWNLKGVAVEDVMAARGVPFRALFILGLNEGVFPRTIREDAFLRDRSRRILESVLGYKVSEKLAAFDEEKLLFTLLVGAARERLYCLYQRSDETGRALAPSWYLAELHHALGSNEAATTFSERTIPRGIVEKQAVHPFTEDTLFPPKELAIRLALRAQEPLPLVELFLPPSSLYKRGRQVMERLEAAGGLLADYDGILGPLSDFQRGLYKTGVSPTSLERYASCPFQFFAYHILRLGRLERPEELTIPGPSDLGILAHTILKSLYQEFLDRGLFDTSDFSVDVQASLDPIVRKAFFEYELKKPVGYPLAWEIFQEALSKLLAQAVTQDLQQLARSGYRPIALEIEANEQLTGDWPVPLKGLVLHGRMDRIDHQPQEGRYRVIDYKLKSGRNRSPEDNHLPRSALRGQRLQPPFYLLLAQRFASLQKKTNTKPMVEAAFYFLASRWAAGPLVIELFPADAWKGQLGNDLKDTLSRIVDGIHRGRFFIQPGLYCNHCEVSEVCRKNHLPTLWRAENDPVARQHRRLRHKNPTKEKPIRGEETSSP